MTMRDATRIAVSPAVPWMLGAVCTLAGFGLGFAAPPISRWAVDTLPTVPGPLEILAELTTAWSVPILCIVGVAAGVALALSAIGESLTITVDSDGALLSVDGDELYVPRSKVHAVFRDGKDLVLIDSTERELARRNADDLNARAVTDAFTAHGYHWTDTNPHEGTFTRWTNGHPDLDEQTHKLLRQRRSALSSKEFDTATELHSRLQAQGIIVRDRDKRQEYRRVT
ncbi:hypothetical protein R3Q06_16460 [Rhodococcus erythropolis]|uniref:YqeB family protein n=1 Tax=Rhodococcus erythropolis TaxID=1833 RepID=UPI0029499710|nr:hypothetical protein [Rhodococcus erythropolis]MDV6275092.1 hypothetical protein [Rhodococcus erythropolis]